jgi:hypothetical protein
VRDVEGFDPRALDHGRDRQTKTSARKDTTLAHIVDDILLQHRVARGIHCAGYTT